MAFKLKREDIQQYRKLVDLYKAASQELREAAEKYKAALETIGAPLSDAVYAFNGAHSTLATFCQEQAEAWREEFHDKSDKWHEGDRAAEVDEFIEKWESVQGYFVELEFDLPEAPEWDIRDFDETPLPFEPDGL